MGPAFKKIFSSGSAPDPAPEVPSSYTPPVEVEPANVETPAWTPAPTPAPAPYAQPVRSMSAKNVLNSDVAVKGTLKFTDDLLIDGIVEGEISSQGVLTIGQNAHVTAEINTSSVIIHGKLHGNVHVTDRIEMKSTAEVIGDIKAATIAIEAGAIFVGRSEVGGTSQLGKAPSKPGKTTPAKEESEAVASEPESPVQATLDVSE